MLNDTMPRDGGDDDGHDYGGFQMRAAILDGHTVVPCGNTLEWARWFERANRHVAETWLGLAYVSTVFLGLDHGHSGTPLWFETAIFRFDKSFDVERYATWEEAEAGHARVVKRERASFAAWRISPLGRERVRVVGWMESGHLAELETGELVGCEYLYRSPRRVPFRAATYARRFGATP